MADEGQGGVRSSARRWRRWGGGRSDVRPPKKPLSGPQDAFERRCRRLIVRRTKGRHRGPKTARGSIAAFGRARPPWTAYQMDRRITAAPRKTISFSGDFNYLRRHCPKIESLASSAPRRGSGGNNYRQRGRKPVRGAKEWRTGAKAGRRVRHD